MAWLRNPRAVKKTTLMPQTPMTEAEASDLAAFVLRTPLTPPTPTAMPKRLPLLQRRVAFEQVKEAILDVTCRHCHGNPDAARGDGGPGNSGGFGFAPRRIDVSSYDQLMSGHIDANGERRSLFEKLDDGTPLLVAALWARHSEVRGKPRPGVRGMPLGLPPLSPQLIQLVESWIAQGRPR